MIGMPTVAEISEQCLGVPWHGRWRLSVDRISVPVLRVAARKPRVCPFGAKRISGCMTGAAMRQPFDQIGAAIPFSTLRAVRLVGPAPKKQEFPASVHESLIERKGQLVFAGGRVNRFPCHQVG